MSTVQYPEGWVPVHFIFQSSKGRIMSQQPGQTEKIQYTSACDFRIGLPARTNVTHGLVADARGVTCPKCQQTPEFLADYKLQTGEDFHVAPENDIPEAQAETP